MTRRIGFLVAGVQKGGTSALFEYLRLHPDLQLPAIKEVHFFDDEAQDWAAPDIAAYHAHFTPDDRLRGEATPIYIYWPQSMARIARYNPGMKIILLFRDPIARAFSHWQMEYSKHKEAEPFAWCIRDGRARVAAGEPGVPGHHRVFSYVERGLYGAQLTRAFASFPPEQFLLLRSEQLDADPIGTLGRVWDFLGVRRLTTVTPRRVHEASAIAYPSELTEDDRIYLNRLFASDQALFERLIAGHTGSPGLA